MTIAAGFGSPPRAWGQLNIHPSVLRESRFTPTRVGTTSLSPSAHSLSPVHPHARGDNATGGVQTAWANGSPPRAWGQPLHLVEYPLDTRFTPTRVGTTSSYHVPPLPTTVHPHARGDNGVSFSSFSDLYGSPPRAWGQPHHALHVERASRFTPTRVGTTVTRSRLGTEPPVHPHARGDNRISVEYGQSKCGSPPRAWGQPYRGLAFDEPSRFTPTRVGTTDAGQIRAPALSVHPHARGDNSGSGSPGTGMYGSPPRAWGQPPRGKPGNHRKRFTPTRVGTTDATAAS